MRISLALAFLLLASFVIAQGNRQPINGTKFSIIPPEDFTVASSFSGFQQTSSGSSIMVTEIPASTTIITGSFTKEALASKGMILLSKKQVPLNQKTATLIYVSQFANETKYFKLVLIFGDTKKTVMVNGIYPEKEKHLSDLIEKSLLSIRYEEMQEANEERSANFSIDVSGTSFKFTKNLSGSLLYTTDGKIPTTGASLAISPSVSTVTSDDKKQYSIARLKKLPDGEEAIVKSVEPVEIDGLMGYEIVAEGKEQQGVKELIYQLMLYTESDSYFIMVGLSRTDKEENLQQFRKLAQTFKRK